MARIAQFEAPEGLGLRPSEVGIAAVAGAARRVQGEYNEAAASKEIAGRRLGSAISTAGEVATSFIDHQEISHGANALAGLVQAKTQQWNDIAKHADPNDPTVAQKFLTENLEPDLDKFRSGFLSQKAGQWAEHHVEQFRQHMFEKTSADMSTLAGQAAVVNSHKTVNGLSNTVYSDPSSLDFALKTLDTSVGGIVDSSPNLSGAAAGKAKGELLQAGREAIVKSAAVGYIEKTGQVPPWATDPKYSPYINGAELKQFEKAATAQRRSDLLTQKQLESYQREQNVQAAKTANSKAFTDNVTFDPATNRPIISPNYVKQSIEIEKKYPGAIPDHAKGVMNWVESQQDRKDATVHTDTKVYGDIIDRMLSTDNPTTEAQILQADAKRQLDPHDFAAAHRLWKFLEEAPVKDPIVRSTLADVRRVIGTDNVGAGLHAAFVQDFIPQYVALKKQGKEAGALNLKDPNSLLSKTLEPYQRTPMQMMMDRASHGLAVGPPGSAGVTGPQVGDTSKGYRFKGGDPAKEENWEKVK